MCIFGFVSLYTGLIAIYIIEKMGRIIKEIGNVSYFLFFLK